MSVISNKFNSSSVHLLDRRGQGWSRAAGNPARDVDLTVPCLSHARAWYRSLFALGWLLGLVVLLTGCEEDVDPFVEEGRPFTVWGYLDAAADTQLVRVFTLQQSIGLNRAGPLDATVTTTDLTTGERRVWTDSVIVFSPTNTGHVYWSDFRAQHGHRYRLEVTRSDGATSSTEVLVPPRVTIDFPADPTNLKIPVRIEGAAPNLIGLGVKYIGVPAYPVNPYPPGTPRPPAFAYPVTVSYDGKAEVTEDGWSVVIDMQEDFATVQDEFLRNCLPSRVVLQRMEFLVLSANEEWSPPGGVFDPNVLVDPGTLTNVDNGFGFFGAGQSIRVTWVPRLDLMEEAGFVLSAPCGFGPAPGCEVNPPCFRCSEALPLEVREIYCLAKRR